MTTFHVERQEDDPLALRASIGGGKTAGDGYYLVYRGAPGDVLAMLRLVVDHFERELSDDEDVH